MAKPNPKAKKKAAPAAKPAKPAAKKAPTGPTPKKAGPTLPDSAISEALDKAMGNVSHAARSLGLTRTALHDRIKRTPALQIVLNDAREEMIDAAENALYQSIVGNQGWAVCFALKTIGKERGYVERLELKKVDVSKLSDEELREIIEAEG